MFCTLFHFCFYVANFTTFLSTIPAGKYRWSAAINGGTVWERSCLTPQGVVSWYQYVGCLWVTSFCSQWVTEIPVKVILIQGTRITKCTILGKCCVSELSTIDNLSQNLFNVLIWFTIYLDVICVVYCKTTDKLASKDKYRQLTSTFVYFQKLAVHLIVLVSAIKISDGL